MSAIEGVEVTVTVWTELGPNESEEISRSHCEKNETTSTLAIPLLLGYHGQYQLH